jgi:hypothetical protein
MKRIKKNLARKAAKKTRPAPMAYTLAEAAVPDSTRMQLTWDRKMRIHTVWYEFVQRFKMKSPESKYRWTAYDLMVRVEKWAKRYPKDVRIVGIDDSYFASSILVLIEHKTARTYMGTTVVVIPQCTGESPLEFFLYPDHRRGLLGALLGIGAAARPIERRERQDRVAEDRAIRKNLRHPAVL